MRSVRTQLERLLRRITGSTRLPPILFLGETGTGKGLAARALHRAGPRGSGPFVALNCAAVPAELFEAELFGVGRGAFTDAREARPGLLRAARGGTLFLDEIGALPAALQAKLLGTIEGREVRSLGSTRSEPVDVWLMAATNEDMLAARRAGRIREDLYHRLATVQVRLPPLRDRAADILVLAEYFLGRAWTEYGLPAIGLAADARAVLRAYTWPGNVRELANVIERAALLRGTREITAADLGLPGETVPTGVGGPLRDAVAEVERTRLLQALEAADGNLSRAARRLGLPRNTLRHRMTRLGLTQAGRRAPLADQAAAPSAWVGPVVWLQVLRDRTDGPSHGRPLDALAAKAAAFGGRVVEGDGAGLLVGFGLEPHEDAPSRAAHAALAIQAAARRAAGEDPTLAPIRVTLHAAPLPIGTATTVLAPDDPVRAVLERLGAEAGSTSIVVSDMLAPHLERRFTLAPVDSTSGQPTGARRLVGLDPTGLGLAGRILSRFVGRDQELAALERWLERVTAGAGQAVVLMGEPGAGKSRLLYEFRRRVALSAATWLEGRCVSSAATPYGAFMEAARQALGVNEDDDPDVVAAVVREHVKGLGLDPEAHARYLQALLGSTAAASSLRELSPEAIRIRTFEALHRLWLGTSLARPLVLAVEDLHWIDPTSAAYLAAFVERLAGARILLVATSRPGPGTAWLSHSHASQLALPPLSATDSLAVIRSIAGLDHLPERTAASIVDRADGNPFFLEELSWSALGPEPDAVDGIAPGSIIDVLRVRIERLPDSPRRVLTTASVLGREVPLDLLRAVARDPDTLDVDVAALKHREMLHDQPGSGEPTLVFKHALTQEAAYGSLPATERRNLHARAAEALESLHADRLPHGEEQIAHHYSRTDRAERAIHYLVRVAQRASRSYALEETVAALREARGHAERLPPGQARDRTILGICVRQGLPLLLLGRTTAFLDLFLPEASRLERLGDRALASQYHAWVALAYNQVGDHAQSVPHGERSLENARAIDDPVAIGRAHYLLAVAAYWASRYRDGIAHGHAAEASLERAGNRFWGGHAQWSLGLNHAALGEFDRALEAVDKLQDAAEHTGDPRMRSFAAMKRGLFRALAGSGAEAVAACREGLRLAPDPFNVGMALMLLGHAHVENDEPARAIECLERAVRELRESGIRTSEGWMGGYLAEAYLGLGDVSRARAAAERAVAVTSAARYPYGLGVALRALGRVALASGDPAGSQVHLNAALRTFADIDARREIGCTHLRLAEVAQARDDPEEAAAQLRDAHARLAALPSARLADRAVALADAFGVSLW